MMQFSSRTCRRCCLLALGAFWTVLSCLAQSAVPTAGNHASPALATPVASPSTFHTSVSDQRIALWQSQVARDPDYWGSYNQLAAAYALKARETGDITYFELAEKSLRESLKLESTHVEAGPAFRQLATVHLAEHRFSDAAEDALKAIALQSGDLAAYSDAGDAELELGNYAEAEKFYKQLVAPPDGLPHAGTQFLAASHGASLWWMEGDTERAIADLQDAITLAQKLHLPGENIAWTEFMLGEQYFQLGDLVSAELQEKASLASFPRYHRALAAMGQIRAAQGRLQEAISSYKDAIAIIPLPLYLAALGDVYAASGDNANAEKQYAVVEFIGKLNAINQQVYNRELALFYADHDRKLPEALILARKELECRHDVYTSDALAWTLLKNGRPDAARVEMAKALRLGTRDALLEYHAGMIELSLGDRAKAASHLQRALQINPHFHVIFAKQASATLARLNAEGTPVTASRAEARDVNQK